MQAKELMTEDVKSCRADDTLCVPAAIMWDRDCGFVPVVDDENHVVGVVTDRDVCMAAYTQGRSLDSIPTRTAMANVVFSCRPRDSMHKVEKLMNEKQVRRLPVLDENEVLIGVVSLSDIACASIREGGRKAKDATIEGMATVLAGVCRPRTLPSNFAAH